MAYKSQKIIMLEYIPLRILMEVISLLPYIFVIFLAKIIGTLMFYVAPRSRKVALINLKQAFPEKSYLERRLIARRSMKSMMMTFAEFIKSSRMTEEQILKRVKIEGLDKFDKALEENKGVVVITGHIGNWEYIASYFGIKGYKPSVIVRPLDNPKLDVYMKSWREKRGMKCIARKWGDLKEIFYTLKDNLPVAFLCDQNYIDGIYVDFFGEKCATAVGPIAVAMKTKSPIVIMYDVPDRYGHHKIVVSEVMYIEEKGSKEETLYYNTQKYTKKLEDIIRKYPENWLWVHPRWNTRPNGEPEIFYKHNNYR